MSFQEQVTSPSGQVKTVVADSKDELDAAVKAVKNEKVPVTVDINLPVRKGHDLLVVEEDGVTQGLTDGRGAHNSPRNAIEDDGSLAGDPDVPFVVQRRGEGTVLATNENLQKVTGEGKTAPLTDKDVEKSDKATNPTAAK